MAAAWLKDAVFYEIYPQSFYDTNGDGIGDLNGILQKLDYVKSLGCNALWLNPCFDSPFKDAGYDVRDYRKVAPRYGTNEDLVRLFQTAHGKGIHVLLDLVPGHTSEEHPWFLESKKAERNEYSDRYIWTGNCFQGAGGIPFISGESERNGAYILNFFKCQPALNYGFQHITESWQCPTDHPAATATREAMKDIMRFWLSQGCDGFRVDMADSLVKYDDADKTGTRVVWRDVREFLDKEFPEAVLVSEWNNPFQALRSGFDADFFLNWKGNGYSTLLRDYENWEGEDHSYFKKDGNGDINRFLNEYLSRWEGTKRDGYISLITGNHDTPRLGWTLDQSELKLVCAVLFTLPGVPFLYYGDEIGMRYLDLPTKEGGYARTGSRTPMQWTGGVNLGFSAAPAEALYLPVDLAPDAPTVEAQEKDPNSLLNTVRAILTLRHQERDLQADGELQILCREQGRPFVYRRGRLTLAVNPSREAARLPLDFQPRRTLLRIGQGNCEAGTLSMGPQSFLVME